MRRLARLAARLYPPAWRARYGVEFDALVEDSGSGWRTLADILKGAIVMQFTRWSFARVVAACGVAGLAVAAIIAFRTSDLYVSSAVMRMGPAMTVAFDGLPPSSAERLRPVAERAFNRSHWRRLSRSSICIRKIGKPNLSKGWWRRCASISRWSRYRAMERRRAGCGATLLSSSASHTRIPPRRRPSRASWPAG